MGRFKLLRPMTRVQIVWKAHKSPSDNQVGGCEWLFYVIGTDVREGSGIEHHFHF